MSNYDNIYIYLVLTLMAKNPQRWHKPVMPPGFETVYILVK